MGLDGSLAKAERQKLVLSLIGRMQLGTQEELREALAAAGCKVTQATISRDISELRLQKQTDPLGRQRYVRPGRERTNDPQATLRALLARRVVAVWDDVDVVLTPTLAKTPVPIGWIFEPGDPWEQFDRGGEFTPFTPLVNVTGQPAASVPFGSVDGLPVGIQLIGPPAGEAVLFRLAAQIEAAHPWAHRRPPR